MKLVGLAASLFAAFQIAISTNVIDLTPQNFDEVVLNSGKPALVEFFAPWCGHCQKLAPTWEKLADTIKETKGAVTIGKVDGDKHKTLSKRYNIKGFPTLKWFPGKSGSDPEEYNSGRDLDSFLTFISKKTNLKSIKKKEPSSSVVVLTDSNFPTYVNGSKHVFVKFYAPWCGHCKSMAPTWEKLAEAFDREEDVIIAKSNADSPSAKATAQKFDISGFPTLKFFVKGSDVSNPLNHEGGRSEQDLIDFVNKHAHTHRLPGGSLDSTAGLIPSLDAIMARYTGDAKDLPGLIKEIKEEVEKITEEIKVDAMYYVRVIERLIKNPEFTTKEIARLEGMIKKGGVKAEKVDDLTKRINILKKFVLKKEDGKDEL